jgi:hypothetical protein
MVIREVQQEVQRRLAELPYNPDLSVCAPEQSNALGETDDPCYDDAHDRGAHPRCPS